MTFVLDALFTTSIIGYLENLSMPGKNDFFIPFSFRIGPPKSNGNSSIGSMQLVVNISYAESQLLIFTISEHALHSLAFARISRWIYGHHMLSASDASA